MKRKIPKKCFVPVTIARFWKHTHKHHHHIVLKQWMVSVQRWKKNQKSDHWPQCTAHGSILSDKYWPLLEQRKYSSCNKIINILISFIHLHLMCKYKQFVGAICPRMNVGHRLFQFFFYYCGRIRPSKWEN